MQGGGSMQEGSIQGEGLMLEEGSVQGEEEGPMQGEEEGLMQGEEEEESMQGNEEEESMQGDEEGSMQGGGGEEGGLILEEASSMQLVMATPTSSTSAEAACGEGDDTGMASILDLMADGLAYTFDRKADIEQGETGISRRLKFSRRGRICGQLAESIQGSGNIRIKALLENLLASLRKEQQKLEAEAERSATSSSQP